MEKCMGCNKEFKDKEKYYNAIAYDKKQFDFAIYNVCEECLNKVTKEFTEHTLGTDKSQFDERSKKENFYFDELDIDEITYDKC